MKTPLQYAMQNEGIYDSKLGVVLKAIDEQISIAKNDLHSVKTSYRDSRSMPVHLDRNGVRRLEKIRLVVIQQINIQNETINPAPKAKTSNP